MITLWQAIATYVQQHVLGVLLALGGGSLALARILLPHYLTKRVDAQFDRQLELHKHELQRVLEQDKFDLRRKLTAGSLFMQKQHAAAAESYSAIRWAHGEISGLFGMQNSLLLEECDRKELLNILFHYKIPGGKSSDLLSEWELDPKTGLAAIRKEIFNTRGRRAEAKLDEARNLMYLNEIYFSDTTRVAFDAFVAVCREWLMKSASPPERGMPYKPYSRPELNGALESVRRAMRNELTNPTSELEPKQEPVAPAASDVA